MQRRQRLLTLLGAAIVVIVMTGVLLANGAPWLEADIQHDARRTVQSSP
jgi:hypothetical protein